MIHALLVVLVILLAALVVLTFRDDHRSRMLRTRVFRAIAILIGVLVLVGVL